MASFEYIIGAGLGLVVLAITLGIGADILTDIQADQTANGYAYNVTLSGWEGVDEMGEWLDTTGLVIAAAFIIGILMTSFGFGRRGGGFGY
jgi:hypothetical protein